MSTPGVPAGYHSVTPYLTVSDLPAELAFLAAAFGAIETEHIRDGEGNSMHAEVRIGDSIVMVGQAREAATSGTNGAVLYLYDPDVDACYGRAMAAGARSFQEPTDQFYGDRTAALYDPAGNQWWIATRKEEVSSDEMARRAAERG